MSLNLYIDEHDEYRDRYQDYFGYYKGDDQQVKLTDRARTFLEANGFEDFRTNVCEVVVDAVAYRLKVTNFTSPDDFGDWAWHTWARSLLGAVESTLYRYTLVMGDGYMVGEWYEDPLRGIAYPRWRFNDARNCYMVYDDDDSSKAVCFLKRWQRRGMTVDSPGPWRLNLYYPDRIEKYEGPPSNSGQGSAWTLESVEAWPSGVIPAVHFTNRAGAEPYGRSELANVVPHQDSLNKMWVDLMNILDQQGWPQRYAIGAQEPKGGWSSAPGMTWNGPPGSEFGQFAAANPIGVLKALEAGYSAVASISRTPQHAFHTPGDRFPSGEALKTAEAGLIEKAEAFASTAGPKWVELLRKSAIMQRTHGEWPPTRPKKRGAHDSV